MVAKPTKDYGKLEQEIIKTASRTAAAAREQQQRKKDEAASEAQRYRPGTPKPIVARTHADGQVPCAVYWTKRGRGGGGAGEKLFYERNC